MGAHAKNWKNKSLGISFLGSFSSTWFPSVRISLLGPQGTRKFTAALGSTTVGHWAGAQGQEREGEGERGEANVCVEAGRRITKHNGGGETLTWPIKNVARECLFTQATFTSPEQQRGARGGCEINRGLLVSCRNSP